VDAHWVYPEWDVRRQSYRRDWCTVREEDPAVDGVPPRFGRDSSLRRPLSRLGLGLELVHRRTQGEDLDIDAAIEARVDLAVGVEPAATVYLESLRRRHDLAVLVLLDISGSANEPSAAGGSVHEQQVAGASALVRAVHALGNRVAVYGFYSQGRAAVRVVRVKRFDEAMNVRVLRRLGSVEPGGYTRFGAAIRHGTSMLEERGGGSRRLLMVLSDGFAYDHGYEGRYGEADARRALAEARQRGVGCLCLSIGAATDLTALRRVFGSAAHGAVRDPRELVQVVGPMFRDALRSAEVQRSITERERLARRRFEPGGSGRRSA
jgi:nitric oxide reductase activation protein